MSGKSLRVSIIVLVFFLLLFTSCKQIEVAIDFDTNNSGRFSYGYTLGLESRSLLDLGNVSTAESLFPFSVKDFYLLGQLIDGMDIIEAESTEQPDGSIVVSAEYSFHTLQALNEMLSYMGLDITSATRGRRQILTVKGITVGLPEVDQVDDIQAQSRLRHWNQVRFAKVMFPDLQLNYQITAPKKIISATQGRVSGKRVVVKNKLENFSDDPAKYVWSIQW